MKVQAPKVYYKIRFLSLKLFSPLISLSEQWIAFVNKIRVIYRMHRNCEFPEGLENVRYRFLLSLFMHSTFFIITHSSSAMLLNYEAGRVRQRLFRKFKGYHTVTRSFFWNKLHTYTYIFLF